MSTRELIRFTLTPRNYTAHETKNGFTEEVMRHVLRESFGITYEESRTLFRRGRANGQEYGPRGGFVIICTPAQFGLFIVKRMNAKDDGVNGIRDLCPELIYVDSNGYELPIDVSDRDGTA